MLEQITEGVNWLAVGAGTIASLLLGGLWYSRRLFGRKWAKAVGLDPANAGAMPMGALFFQLLATLLLACVVGVTETRQDLFEMILVVLTIAAFIVANGLFARKGQDAIIVEAGFVLAMGAVMFLAQVIL